MNDNNEKEEYMYYEYNAIDYSIGKELINEFYIDFSRNLSEEKLYKRLDSYINLIGDSVSDYMKCFFANEYSKDDYEYFADSGVLFVFEYPQVFDYVDYMNNGEINVILTNEEFYSVISQKCFEYCSKHPNVSIDRVHDLLSKLKENLNNNYAKDIPMKK